MIPYFIMGVNKKVLNATKCEEDGIKFDSRLERFMYIQLRDNKIPFELKTTVELIPKFQFEGKSIRSMSIIPDFYLPHLNSYVDTKGWSPQATDQKIKLFKYTLSKTNPTAKVVILKNQKEVLSYINELIHT